jgi:hypothetical protein
MICRRRPRTIFPPPGTPPGPGLRNKGVRSRGVLTVNGEVRVSRRYLWAKGRDGVCPADAALGVDDRGVSPGAREALAMMGMANDFRGAAAAIKRLTGIGTSPERVRQVTHREAARVSTAGVRGAITPAFPAGAARVYLGVDGVLVPLVTQAEKDTRRARHRRRRRKRRRAGIKNRRALPPARPGSDQRYKEMKIGYFYDQRLERRHVFATHEDHTGFGARLRAQSDLVGFARARERVAITDGAAWIKWQVYQNTPTLTAHLLDFYHLAQHVHEAARRCFGETPPAKEWSGRLLHQFKHGGAAEPLGEIEAARKQSRSASKRQSLRLLSHYVSERLEMLDYRAARARGWPIGSGPTEAMCKNLTLRIKRTGAKWDADHASNLMNLAALYESNQADAYWQTDASARHI